jgi:beta-N-acetylhexosaminidase
VKLALALILSTLRIAAAAGLVLFALYWRSPILASIRMPALFAFVAAALALIALEIWWRRGRAWPASAVSTVIALGAAGALALTLATEAQFHWQKQQVLAADADAVARLGRHLIVGYRKPDQIRGLIERRAVAGVFITAHNIRGKDADTVRAEIASFQAIRKRQGLPSLLIATDQEGGGVSRMSPPLPRDGTLGDIVRAHADPAERTIAIRQFATRKAKALADLGINLNFSPVVDLNHNVVNADDRYTRIYKRAISDDPAIVTDTAGAYCEGLVEAGVHCTLKHFPGLGRVIEDTHLEDADLTAPIATLERTDWVPFRTLMNRPGIFTMLGHARVTAIDGTMPASASQRVVAGLLRETWKHDGVLVTDDFSMGAVYGAPGGLPAAGVAALNAGVDLILISYDADLYFPVMHELIRAEAAGRLDRTQLDRSARRIGQSTAVKPGPGTSARGAALPFP